MAVRSGEWGGLCFYLHPKYGAPAEALEKRANGTYVRPIFTEGFDLAKESFLTAAQLPAEQSTSRIVR